jgi:hypothetical protein
MDCTCNTIKYATVLNVENNFYNSRSDPANTLDNEHISKQNKLYTTKLNLLNELETGLYLKLN